MQGATLHHIARETGDVHRLANFYQKVLGFKPIETPSFGDIEVVWLGLTPSMSLHIIKRNPASKLPESPDPNSVKDPSSLPAAHHLAFSVPDYDACIPTVKDMQIPIFEKMHSNGKTKQAFFFDPDGKRH